MKTMRRRLRMLPNVRPKPAAQKGTAIIVLMFVALISISFFPAESNADESDPLEIWTKQDLDAVRNGLNKNYILMNDIVFTDEDFEEGGAFYNEGRGWVPIGEASASITINNEEEFNAAKAQHSNISPSEYDEFTTTYRYNDGIFSGTFDGGGHSIKGLRLRSIGSVRAQYVGLFGRSSGTIEHLNVDVDIDIRQQYVTFAGGIVGLGNIVQGCSAEGSISACTIGRSAPDVRAGGIAGRASVSRCFNKCDIYASTGNDRAIAGGIAASGDVEDCFNTGIVDGKGYTGTFIGGIAGGDTNVTRCYNVGKPESLIAHEIASTHPFLPTDVRYSVCLYDGASSDDRRVKYCTDEQMREESTYSHFDFDGVWAFDEEGTYPYPVLRDVPCDVACLSNADEDIAVSLNQPVYPKTTAVTPNIKVLLGELLLENNRDYSLYEIRGTQAPGMGQATARFFGKRVGFYDFEFPVTPYSIENNAIVLEGFSAAEYYEDGKPVYRWDGETCTPDIVLKNNSASYSPTNKAYTLIEGEDYTVSFEGNSSASIDSDAICTITGIGCYEGVLTKHFKVVPANLSSATVTVEPASLYYTGKALTPTVTVTLNGRKLVKDSDYTVSYSNNINAGTAMATIEGKGNYTGAKSATFKISIKTTVVNASWQRIWGKTAPITMQNIAAKFGRTSYAVVTTDASYKDALAASALAGKCNGLVLMTNKSSLTAQTKATLKAAGVKTVYIVGSTANVSANVEKQLKSGTGVTKVVRIAGTTPSQRAVAAAKVGGKKSDTVIVATQNGFQDALSIAPYAYATKSPILYAETNKKLSSATVSYIKGAKYKKAIIVGGPVALPASIDSQLRGAGVTSVTRIAGSTAYDTSSKIAQWSTGQLKNGSYGKYKGKALAYVKFQPSAKMSPDRLAVATGQNWKDALAGAALCGKNRSVLLLADSKTSKSNYTLAASFCKSNRTKISTAYVFGGTSAVSEKVLNALMSSTKYTKQVPVKTTG